MWGRKSAALKEQDVSHGRSVSVHVVGERGVVVTVDTCLGRAVREGIHQAAGEGGTQVTGLVVERSVLLWVLREFGQLEDSECDVGLARRVEPSCCRRVESKRSTTCLTVLRLKVNWIEIHINTNLLKE